MVNLKTLSGTSPLLLWISDLNTLLTHSSLFPGSPQTPKGGVPVGVTWEEMVLMMFGGLSSQTGQALCHPLVYQSRVM